MLLFGNSRLIEWMLRWSYCCMGKWPISIFPPLNTNREAPQLDSCAIFSLCFSCYLISQSDASLGETRDAWKECWYVFLTVWLKLMVLSGCWSQLGTRFHRSVGYELSWEWLSAYSKSQDQKKKRKKKREISLQKKKIKYIFNIKIKNI